MQSTGVILRPHLKTAKSAEIASIATIGEFGGITVSTLAEAKYFLSQGITDITYAVGIVPEKLVAQMDGQLLGQLSLPDPGRSRE